jgi:hypothetical protein
MQAGQQSSGLSGCADLMAQKIGNVTVFSFDFQRSSLKRKQYG